MASRSGTIREVILILSLFFGLSSALVAQGTPAGNAATTMRKWVDKDTGHMVTQLTSEPNSKVLYFNENAFTKDGSVMIYTGDNNIFSLDLGTKQTTMLAQGPVNKVVVAKKHPVAYFTKFNDNVLYSVNVVTGRVTTVTTLPPNGLVESLNSDETLIAGTYVDGNGLDKLSHAPDPNLPKSSIRATYMDERLAAHLPMTLFTLSLETGKTIPVLHSTDWISHVQFSPVDPHLIMYCHEGLWMRVDRIWTIRTDGSSNEKIHNRMMNNEIAGHEFWDADGKTIWYDLQIPRGQNFYLASYNTETKDRRWYSVERDAWSIHFNAASDDSVFAGDGGDYSQVAKSKNGQWIELLSPRQNPGVAEVEQRGLVQSGFFVTQHLVNMAKHDYTLEPNVRFSPDHKLVIFNSNMFGPSYIFAVEVAKAKPLPTPTAQ